MTLSAWRSYGCRVAFLLLSCATALAASEPAGRLDAARLAQADREPDQWLTPGRDAGGSFHSPLTDINERNVGRLGFAWQYRTGTQRGLEATPVVIDGRMYTSGQGGIVYALDAATGKQLWVFDPHNDGQRAFLACCDMVNRGVAVWQGRVYVGSIDGRLIALDAATGVPVWQTDTIADHALPYTITGAPRIAGDVVVIGNGGGDQGRHGVRGYVSAYDLKSGLLVWRFYTVPGPPGSAWPGQAQAARGWDPTRDPASQGGGTVWDGTAYDPALHIVYIGVGNGSPYYGRTVATGFAYDNLYLNCIVALDARHGVPLWHYQTTPGDIWDFDADAPMVLADLKLGGRMRHVLMQASKNGFFYVLDRRTGEVLSAKPFTDQNWARALDGHANPVPAASADYGKSPRVIAPSALGAHSWQPMSFSPQTGLVYIPVTNAREVMVRLDTGHGAATRFIDGEFDTAFAVIDSTYRREDLEPDLGPLPAQDGTSGFSTSLLAWDPVAGRAAWSRQTWQGQVVAPGGVLSTDGGLVFEGGADGVLRVYSEKTGKVLKAIQTGTTIMAAPMTYRVGGVQYVAVMAGWGGGLLLAPFPAGSAADKYRNDGRILAFRLDGAANTPLPPARDQEAFEKPPVLHASAAQIRQGESLFVTNCSRCHLFGNSIIPDLRKPHFGSWDERIMADIVLGDALARNGMGSFSGVLSPPDVEALHAYINDMSWRAYTAQENPAPHR